MHKAAQRRGGDDDTESPALENHGNGQERNGDDEQKTPRRRRRHHGGPIDCPMCLVCSFEDAFWWTVAFVALVVVVNYAYANLAPSHRGTGYMRIPSS